MSTPIGKTGYQGVRPQNIVQRTVAPEHDLSIKLRDIENNRRDVLRGAVQNLSRARLEEILLGCVSNEALPEVKRAVEKLLVKANADSFSPGGGGRGEPVMGLFRTGRTRQAPRHEDNQDMGGMEEEDDDYVIEPTMTGHFERFLKRKRRLD